MSHDGTLDELRKLAARARLVAEVEAETDWDGALGRMFNNCRDEIERAVDATGNVLENRDSFVVLFVCYFFIHRMLRQIPNELHPGLPDMTRALFRLAEDAAKFVADEEEQE